MYEEVWKDIIGYEGYYQVSNRGSVRSLDREVPLVSATTSPYLKKRKGKKLSLCPTANGYYTVGLYKNNKGVHHSVHRLVAKHFLSETAETVNHKNGDKTNNCVENLEWCSQRENTIHRSKVLGKARGQKQHLSKLTEGQVLEVSSRLRVGESVRGLAREYGVSASSIHSIKTGESWSWLTGIQQRFRDNEKELST